MAPKDVILGRNASIGIAAETTEGTAVSAANVLRLASLTVDEQVTRVRVPDLDTGTYGVVKARYVEQIVTNVSFEAFGYYENGAVAAMIRMCIGGTWADTGAGPYTHTLAMGALKSWTIRTARDTLSSTGALTEGDIIAGFKVADYTWSIETGGLFRIQVNGQAVSRTATTAPAHSLPVHDDPIVSHDGATWDWNSVSYVPRTLTVTGNNGLLGIRGFGSAQVSNHVRNDVRDIRVSVGRYKLDDSWLDAHIAGTESDGTITFTSASSETLTMTAYNSIIIDPVPAALTTVGVVEETAVFQPRDDGSDPPFEVVLVNDDATAEAS